MRRIAIVFVVLLIGCWEPSIAVNQPLRHKATGVEGRITGYYPDWHTVQFRYKDGHGVIQTLECRESELEPIFTELEKESGSE